MEVTTFNHIDAVWEALEKCKTMKEVEGVLDNIPRKFGEWWCGVVDADHIEVTNQWWDNNIQDFMFESSILNISAEVEE